MQQGPQYGYGPPPPRPTGGINTAGWVVLSLALIGGLLVVGLRMGGKKASAAPDSGTSPVLEAVDVAPFVEQMRASPGKLGRRVRVRGVVSGDPEYGYATNKTRIDIVPEGESLPYVMCLAPERRRQGLEGLKGRSVVVEGDVAPMAIDFPVLKFCSIVEIVPPKASTK